VGVVSIPVPPPANGRIAVEELGAGGRSGCVLVTLIGEFDMSNVHHLRDQLSTALDSSPAAVILDLAGLDFADSTVLGVLVAADRRASVGGAELRLAAPPPFLQRLLKITNLETVLAVFSDLESAKTA
jgi:anti-sigma B factor antagonist